MFKVGLNRFKPFQTFYLKCRHFECYLQAISGDMRAVRAAYMKQWVTWANFCGKFKNNLDENGKTKMVAANAAWLESPLRAQIMAARTGQQY